MIKHIAKKVISFLCGFMDTPYFAILLVSIELFCFYFGLDLVIIGTISFFISLAFLFKKKLNCVLVIFLFMSSMISIEKSPAGVQPTSDVLFYFKPPVYIFCIICVSIPALIILCKAFLNIIKKQIRIDTFFVTCIFFAFALSMNGIFIEKTNFLNFMFGFFMLLHYIRIFASIKQN